MKLKKKDIVILSEGSQVQRAILAKYASIDDFIDANNFLYMPSTLQTLCNSRVITNQRFKINLMLALGRDYHEIVVTKKEQIKKYCWHLFKNIYDYDKEDDKEVLEYLTELCRVNEMSLEYALMHRNIGYYYYNMNNIEACTLMYDRSMELFEKLGKYNYRVMCLCDLGLIHTNQYDYRKASEVFERAEKIVSSGFEVEPRFLYLYYYRKGILLNRTGKFKEARVLFEESLKYTDDRYWIGFSLNNIGLAWKREGNEDKALEIFLSQIALFTNNENESQIRCNLYNNIADLYKDKKDFETALHYINLAFNHAPKSNIEDITVIFINFAEIKSALGQELNVIDKLIELLDNIDVHVQTKLYIIKAIDTVIDIYRKNHNDKLFSTIAKLIIKLIDNIGSHSNPAYLKALKECYGELHYIKAKGGKNNV